MGKHAIELSAGDPFLLLLRQNLRGNMNTSLVRTNLGKTVLIQHDVSSVRPYSRIHVISGLQLCSKYPEPKELHWDTSGSTRRK
jgi:hypothetical protein